MKYFGYFCLLAVVHIASLAIYRNWRRIGDFEASII